MSELGSLLADTVTRLFTDLVTKELIESSEKGVWPDKLWRALEEGGLTLPLVSESAGGAGGTWLDAHVVVRASGRHTAPVPLAETIVAGWLLSRAGLEVPFGPMTLAPVHRNERLTLTRSGNGWRVSGTATRVPWGRAAGHVVTVADVDGAATVALVAPSAAKITEDKNLALEPRDTLVFEDAPVVAAAPAAGVATDAIRLYGAMVRAAQMAGALDSILEQGVRYATERKQFGRPIGNFQALQHYLAVVAGHVAASGIAAEQAFRAVDRAAERAGEAREPASSKAGEAREPASSKAGEARGPASSKAGEARGPASSKAGEARDPASFIDIAAAKIRVGEAAGVSAGLVHQVHGAIGFTYEHSLHFATRRLWSWRAEFGSESGWAIELGRRVAARGADNLWNDLTERQGSTA